MLGNRLTNINSLPGLVAALALLAFSDLSLRAEEPPKFLGPQSCATSGCHGGAGDKNKQYTVWAKYDIHHERPFATLTTARSERIAETLKLGDPTQSARCTACHAPMQTVPAARRDPAIKISDGVSCENCHGPAENWLLSHTRTDYTHADRVNAGMRDLQNLYVRANTCVACHQNVDADILAAGHPTLLFELDGQCVTQPKHWQETTNFNGAQAWLVGQAVALREISWMSKTDSQTQKEEGLNLVLNHFFPLSGLPADPNQDHSPPTRAFAESLARNVSQMVWSDQLSWKFLNSLSDPKTTRFDFVTNSIPSAIRTHYAERLVLGLDRLVTALPELEKNAPVQAALKQLFKDVQSLPDFKPAVFAEHLAEFQKALPKP